VQALTAQAPVIRADWRSRPTRLELNSQWTDAPVESCFNTAEGRGLAVGFLAVA